MRSRYYVGTSSPLSIMSSGGSALNAQRVTVPDVVNVRLLCVFSGLKRMRKPKERGP